MPSGRESRWRHILPWLVSAGLLAYVFGWATDWQRLRDALAGANGPLFLLYATADRLAFFGIWTLLWAAALRRFVADVSTSSVVAIRGGSELLRAVSNPLSDAAFFLGLVRLSGGRLEAVVAAALVPTVCHFIVMVAQMTVALPFLENGLAANRDVTITLGITWAVLVAVGIALTREVPLPGMTRIRGWLERFPVRDLWPFLGAFAALAAFDVLIQGLASRAFGVPIGWAALAARIPIVYLSFLIPTLGNFGTRELAWAALFEEFGPRDTLLAYAFAINAVFLVLNVLIGLVFLPRAIELAVALRDARRSGEVVPRPPHPPTDL